MSQSIGYNSSGFEAPVVPVQLVMHDRSIALKTTALNVLTALTYHHSGPKCRPTVRTNKTQLHRHLRKCANMAALVST